MWIRAPCRQDAGAGEDKNIKFMLTLNIEHVVGRRRRHWRRRRHVVVVAVNACDEGRAGRFQELAHRRPRCGQGEGRRWSRRTVTGLPASTAARRRGGGHRNLGRRRGAHRWGCGNAGRRCRQCVSASQWKGQGVGWLSASHPTRDRPDPV